MPQSELTSLYNIKTYRGTICTENTEKQFVKMCYICLRSTTKWKHRSTDKDTTYILKHSKSLSEKQQQQRQQRKNNKTK